MGAPRTIEQGPEILVLRDDQTMLIQRPLQNGNVTEMGINITREDSVMAGGCQRKRHPAPNVVIYQQTQLGHQGAGKA